MSAWREPVVQLALAGRMDDAVAAWRAATGDSVEAAQSGVMALIGSETPPILTRTAQATARFGTGKGSTETYERGQIWLGRTTDPSAEAVGFSDDRHIVTIAGSRSGKGTSAIVPNLCNYPGSVICIDPKGENATVSARRRADGSDYAMGMGQEVAVLDPFGVADVPDALRASFNPLDLIDIDGPDAIDEAKAIAEAIVVSDDPKDMHWTESARQWVAALALYVKVVAHEGSRDLDMVRLLLTRGLLPDQGATEGDSVSGFQELIRLMKGCNAAHGAIAAAAETLDGMATDERGSVLSFARRNTAFLDSPRMKAVTSSSTFDLGALKTSARGLSIYLCLPVKDLGNHGRWLRLMVMLSMAQMEKLGHRPPASGHPVLFLLDEFASLGHMRPVEQAIGYIAGFGVKLWIVLQDLQQLQANYRHTWSTFLANAGVLQSFGNNDQLTLDYLSKRLGDTEVRQYTSSESKSRSLSESTSTNYSTTQGTSNSTSNDRSTTRAPRGLIFRGKRLSESDSKSGSVSRDESKTTGGGSDRSWTDEEGQSRSETISIAPLLRPDEIERRFGAKSGLQLVIVSGTHPIVLRRVDYFSDLEFEGKFDPHPAHPDDKPLTLAERERRRRAALELEAAARNAPADAVTTVEPKAAQVRAPNKNLRYLYIAGFFGLALVIKNLAVDTGPKPPLPDAPKPPREAPRTVAAPPPPPPAAAPARQAVAARRLGIAAIGANLRATPDDRGAILAQLERGALVSEVQRNDTHVQVRTDDGTTGWMAKKVLIDGADVDRLSSIAMADYVASRNPNGLLNDLRAQLKPLQQRLANARQAMLQRSPDTSTLLSELAADRRITIASDPGASIWYLWSTQAAQRDGDKSAAVASSFAGIVADPSEAEHFVAFGLAKYEQREYAQLHSAAEFLPLLAPATTNAWMVVGLSEALRDLPDHAAAAFGYAISVSKNAERTRKYFVSLADDAGDARVAAAIRTALRTSP